MKKKFSRFLSLSIAAVMLVGLCACGDSGNQAGTPSQGGTDAGSDTGDGKVYSLSLSTHDPATSNKTKFHEAWAQRINEASGGRIEITVYSAGSLAAGTAALDALINGVCDIAWIYPPYFPGQFPLSDVVTLPIGIDSVPQATNVLWDLYEENEALQAELSEFVPLMIHSNPVNFISATGDKQVDSLDDLRGMKFRASAGTASDLLLAWGATPMQMAPGDIFQAVEKGTIDGYIFDYSGIKSFNLQEVTNNYTDMATYLGPYYLMMNKASLAQLPEDLQQIILENSTREASLELAYIYEADEREGKQICIDNGGNIIPVSDEAKAEFRIAAQPVTDAWIANNSADGVDAQAMVDRATALAEQYYISVEDLEAELSSRGLS